MSFDRREDRDKVETFQQLPLLLHLLVKKGVSTGNWHNITLTLLYFFFILFARSLSSSLSLFLFLSRDR